MVAQRGWSVAGRPSSIGARASSARCGLPSANARAAVARRIPAPSASSAPARASGRADRRPVAPQGIHEDDARPRTSSRRGWTGSSGVAQPVRGPQLLQRLVEAALPEPHEGPGVMERRLRLELRPGRLRGRSTRSSQRSASSVRPSHASADRGPGDRGGERCGGCPIRGARRSPRPPRSAAARRPVASSRGSRPARGGRGSRPPGRAGRCGARSASASSRSRRASSSCSDHSSATPRFIRADARWSLARASSSSVRASHDRIASRAVAQVAALARQPEPGAGQPQVEEPPPRLRHGRARAAPRRRCPSRPRRARPS